MTNCKHDYHLQCILEWCQRSSQCPMCWQPISMKDPLSQELLEAVEQERNIRANRSHNTAVFHHPMLGDFEIPVGADDAELEERIIQHLAAAAAVRRSHRHHNRRDGHRSRSGASSHPQFLVLSADEHTTSGEEGDYEQAPAVVSGRPLGALVEQERTRGLVDASSPSLRFSTPADGRSNNRISGIQSTPVDQDGAGPSDLQSISDTLRSRLQSASMRYKDSITKSASGWRERWFSRSNSLSDLGSEVRREVNAGIAAVSRMMERHDARDGSGPSPTFASGSGSQ
ncbi:hypothetical protein BDA96_01G065200 [Sorghum bicolor]|nr:hypothetical protein BDA96_01G065200 [Sorghum bicolor]KAG0547268.1 hypothetical protein BDA96_01G065200 [Sorghum bicolor]